MLYTAIDALFLRKTTVKTHHAERRHETPARPAAGDCFGSSVRLDVSEHTDPNVEMKFETFVSVDGGLTWEFAGGCSCFGVPLAARDQFMTNEVHFSTAVTNIKKDRDGNVESRPRWINPLTKTALTIRGGGVNTEIIEHRMLDRR